MTEPGGSTYCTPFAGGAKSLLGTHDEACPQPVERPRGPEPPPPSEALPAPLLEPLPEPLPELPPEPLPLLTPELLPEPLLEMPPDPLPDPPLLGWLPELPPEPEPPPELLLGVLPLVGFAPELGAGMVPLLGPVGVPTFPKPPPSVDPALQLLAATASGNGTSHANKSALKVMTYLRRLLETAFGGNLLETTRTPVAFQMAFVATDQAERTI